MTAGSRLWFSLLAPPAAFGIEGLAGWALGAAVCTATPIGTARGVLAIVSLVMVVTACAALVNGIGNYREASAARDAAADRIVFMSLGGVLVSASFIVGIIWFGLNAALVTRCGGMR